MSQGVLHSINISDGGVPKLPRPTCMVRTNGLEGDRQNDLKHHGGPKRAVCLYSLELIQALQAEGHAITPGSTGENFTLSGFPWEKMTPGLQLKIGETSIVITSDTPPCKTIVKSFQEGKFVRIAEKKHPGWSRWYASVFKEGMVKTGDQVHIIQ